MFEIWKLKFINQKIFDFINSPAFPVLVLECWDLCNRINRSEQSQTSRVKEYKQSQKCVHYEPAVASYVSSWLRNKDTFLAAISERNLNELETSCPTIVQLVFILSPARLTCTQEKHVFFTKKKKPIFLYTSGKGRVNHLSRKFISTCFQPLVNCYFLFFFSHL